MHSETPFTHTVVSVCMKPPYSNNTPTVIRVIYILLETSDEDFEISPEIFLFLLWRSPVSGLLSNNSCKSHTAQINNQAARHCTFFNYSKSHSKVPLWSHTLCTYIHFLHNFLFDPEWPWTDSQHIVTVCLIVQNSNAQTGRQTTVKT